MLVLEKSDDDQTTRRAAAGVRHFGFRLVDPADIDAAAAAIERAGGTITDKGEFVPGEPYVFFRDPDGCAVEVWYEIPTRIDPAYSALRAHPPERQIDAAAVGEPVGEQRRGGGVDLVDAVEGEARGSTKDDHIAGGKLQ